MNKDIALGVKNMKQLVQNLKAYAEYLQDEAVTEIEKTIARGAADDIINEVNQIYNVDGNYDGYDNVASSVFVFPDRTGGHSAVWRGSQIAFIEFGTGAEGMANVYPNAQAMAEAGYHPDPSKWSWVYWDKKLNAPLTSFGLAPQQPVYTAALYQRMAKKDGFLKYVSEKAINHAFTL